MKLKVGGFDPSLRNWGIATGTYDTRNGKLSIETLDVIQPVKHAGKQVRKNSQDLACAQQLAQGALDTFKQGLQATFVEVPVGSQSARAMASYGVCVGVLGAFRAIGMPFYEITPTEVKKVATGRSTATKREMIQWACDQHPEAPWPFQTKKGVTTIVESTAEHMADAVAAIHAGIQSAEFQRYLALAHPNIHV